MTKDLLISVSAPGKLIMFGEHAVVYGKKALATSLAMKCYLHVKKVREEIIKIALFDFGQSYEWPLSHLVSVHSSVADGLDNVEDVVDESLLGMLKDTLKLDDYTRPEHLAVLTLLYIYLILNHKKTLVGFEMTVESRLPIGAGLGSSAAYNVSLTAALLALLGRIRLPELNDCSHHDFSRKVQLSNSDLQLVNKWSFLAEKIIHGTPSGIDNSVATFGGALWFQDKKIRFIEKMPNLKILLVNTNVSRSTKQLVQLVRKKVEEYPEILNPILEAIEGICTKCADNLEEFCELQKLKTNNEQLIEHLQQARQQMIKHQQNDVTRVAINNDTSEDITNTEHGDSNDDCCRRLNKLYSIFNDLIDMNQQLLAFLGVSHRSLDEVVAVCGKYQVHVKLTGAGGGGCAYALLAPDCRAETVEKMVEELNCLGYKCFESSIGGQGVEISVGPL